MIYAFAALAIVLAAAGAVFVFRSVDLLIRRQVKRRVVVELRSGATYEGLLMSVDGRTLLLRDAMALTGPQSSPVPVDGELLLPRSDVNHMQRP